MEEFLNQLNRAWNSHNIDQVLVFYSPDYEGEDVGLAQPQRGLDGLAKMLSRYWQAFPDLRFTEDERIIQDDRVAQVWTAQGTHLGRIMNIPPTHRRVFVHGTSILQIRDSKVLRARYIWDVAGILRSIGLLPDLAPE
jgi:steroid delta-isomerase-like uncharacterized protein